MSSPAVIVFLRAPEKGKVKTRLCNDSVANQTAGLDESFVLALYKAFVEDLLDGMGKTENVFLFFHPHSKHSIVENWLGPSFVYLPQKGNDIGQKMAHAFKTVFEKDHDRVILVGTDIPEMDQTLLVQALDILNQNDVVIGPSRDGGYYLIGIRKHAFSKQLFTGVGWSGPEVLEQTLSAIARKSLSHTLIQALDDIDTSSDYLELKSRVVSGEAYVGPKTRRLLTADDS